MSASLIVHLSGKEQIYLTHEIERLFYSLDAPLPVDKKVHLVRELSVSGIPFSAIIRGIKDLYDQDMKRIRLCDLKDAAKKHVKTKDGFANCRYCGTSGSVSMQSAEKRVISYPCICARGTSIANTQKLVQWNGKRSIRSRDHGIVRMTWPNPVVLNIPEATEEELNGSPANISQHDCTDELTNIHGMTSEEAQLVSQVQKVFC